MTNLQSRFAKSFEQRLKQTAREMPTLNVRAHMRAKFRIESQQIFDRRFSLVVPAEMSAGRRHYEVWPEESGYVHPIRAFESLLVFAFVEMIPERSEVHPAGVVGIQFHRAAHDRGASLELAGVHDL